MDNIKERSDYDTDLLFRYQLYFAIEPTDPADYCIILYFVLKGIPFDPESISQHSHDDILAPLFELSSITPGNLDKHSNLYEFINSCPKDEFERDYPNIIKSIFASMSVDHISFFVSENIIDYVRHLGCLKIWDEGQSFFLFSSLPNDMEYRFAENSNSWYPFIPLFKDAFNINRKPYSVSAPGSTVYIADYECNRIDALIARCLSEGQRYVIIPSLQNYDGNSEIIESWLRKGWLKEIIDCNEINYKTDPSAVFVVLDLGDTVESVIYKDCFGNYLTSCPISYEEIRNNGYYIDPSVYILPTPNEGEELIELGNLCTLSMETIGYSNSRELPYYDYSYNFKRICINSDYPRKEEYQSSIYSKVFKGPHLHITYGAFKMQMLISNTLGYYHCKNETSFALHIKDNQIDQKYLAYVLLRDDSFARFISFIIPDELFLKRKIAVNMNRKEQEAIVQEYLAMTDDVVRSDARYNLIWADPDINNVLNATNQDKLQEWQIDQTFETDTIYSNNSHDSVIKERADEVDAMIMDATTDALNDRFIGLRMALKTCRKMSKPLYLYTDIDESALKLDLDPDDFEYLSNGRIFRKSNPLGFRQLITSVRLELDNKGIPVALMMGKFVKEFDAANWLDNEFNLSITSDLKYFLSQPNNSLNKLRGSFKTLFRIIVDEIHYGSGLENVDLGLIPTLLENGSVQDSKTTGKVFIIDGDVLPKTLAHALRYAVDITNGASHTETTFDEGSKLAVTEYIRCSDTSHLANSVLEIFMDFILFLYNTGCEFDAKCISRNIYEKQKADWHNCPLHKVSNNEYFCDAPDGSKVHVQFKSEQYRENMALHIIDVAMEGKYIDKYKLFAPQGCWEIEE